jgi:hypothetical protein
MKMRRQDAKDAKGRSRRECKMQNRKCKSQNEDAPASSFRFCVLHSLLSSWRSWRLGGAFVFARALDGLIGAGDLC